MGKPEVGIRKWGPFVNTFANTTVLGEGYGEREKAEAEHQKSKIEHQKSKRARLLQIQSFPLFYMSYLKNRKSNIANH